MKRKSQNIINKFYSVSAVLLLLVVWQLVCSFSIVPEFMLPSPAKVVQAFINDFGLLMSHSVTSLMEAGIGLALGVLIGFIAAVFMDHYDWLYKGLYPLIVLTQTIPTVAIAPLLVLWLGYEMAPKVVLIIIVTFFPIAVGVLNGFRSADKDTIHLLRSMGAGKVQIFWHVKFPSALGAFFSSLRISISYSIVGAVIAEWLGGTSGLGVYMTRVRKSFSFDKMFAVIFLISFLSLLLMALVAVLQKKCMPWEQVKKEEE
ncbi:MAG TPA: nitrate ABC transporter permease [Lachnospiraceae bacterium]|nr:nitrate ABC transporter permease [Lachnospiraceae bacterium]